MTLFDSVCSFWMFVDVCGIVFFTCKTHQNSSWLAWCLLKTIVVWEGKFSEQVSQRGRRNHDIGVAACKNTYIHYDPLRFRSGIWNGDDWNSSWPWQALWRWRWWQDNGLPISASAVLICAARSGTESRRNVIFTCPHHKTTKRPCPECYDSIILFQNEAKIIYNTPHEDRKVKSISLN